jgi:hypothetical protein
MSERIAKSWLVFTSIENLEHNRCADLFSRPDGSYGFEEFRREGGQGRLDAGPVLLRFRLCVAGGHACGGDSIRGLVSRRNPAQPLCTKIAVANFKLRHYSMAVNLSPTELRRLQEFAAAGHRGFAASRPPSAPPIHTAGYAVLFSPSYRKFTQKLSAQYPHTPPTCSTGSRGSVGRLLAGLLVLLI